MAPKAKIKLIKNHIKKMVRIRSFIIIMILFLGFVSCKKELSEQQKVFLDFAKQENIYGGTGYYYNLDLNSNYIDEPVYYDSVFNFQKLKKELQQNFKLLKGVNGDLIFDYSQTSFPIQYPYKFSSKQTNPGTYTVDFSIFIPQKYEQFSLNKENIGEQISKDGMNITLLDLRNDGATLLVESTVEKQDYAYTKGIRSDRKENVADPLGYKSYVFLDEHLTEPNAKKENRNAKENELEFNFDRLNITASDAENKTIQCEARIIDFRHYLWYRNNDMPYPDMISSYRDLNNRYQEAEKNLAHKYNPIYVLNIRALGKIEKLNFFLRSHKGKIEVVNLGEIKVQERINKETEDSYNYNPVYETYPKLTNSNAKQHVKINVTAVNDKNTYALYASLPFEYSQFATLNFEDIYFKTEKNDTLAKIRRDNTFDVIMGDPTNIISEIIQVEDEKYKVVKGKVVIEKQDHEDEKFNINDLPASFTYNEKENLMIYKMNDRKDLILFAFENSDLKKSIPYKVQYVNEKDHYSIQFKTPPHFIIIRKDKDKESISVPFEFKLPQKEVE